MSAIIEKARELAKKHHGGELRASGETLYQHLEKVYQKLVDAGITDEKVLAGALLHHLPGKLNQAIEIITNEIDAEVGELVKLYHNLAQMNIKTETPKNFNHNYIVQTYMNLAEDMRVLVIALANQCHNVETAFALPQEERLAVAEKTLFIYAPIAKMLGIGDFTVTLENESFKILNPGMYTKVQKALDAKSIKIQEFFNESVPVIKGFLLENGVESQITHRTKHIYSIYKKSERYLSKGVEVGEDFDSIYDIGAMRIIVQDVKEVYTVEDILKSLWDQIPHLRDDYIQKPRPTGYRSLHNTFKIGHGLNIEVQIRTKEMHEKSEYGLYSHLFYKIGEKFKKELLNNPNWVKDLNYFESYDRAKISHFANNVYAFTPKGDIVELPKGAKAVDFAYYVHTDIGNMCAGAKINGNIAKIDTLIKDGDVVEILVDKNKHEPSKDWLQTVGTKKAKWEILKELRKGR
jgi:GTP diphosphokinase / guanosine-3',5'-bis(diphosphate) 3'-diphosphatase